MTGDPAWFHESLRPDSAQSLRVDEMLHDSETDQQRLKVFRNGSLGRALTPDDAGQTIPLDVLEGRFGNAGISTGYKGPMVDVAAIALPGHVLKLMR